MIVHIFFSILLLTVSICFKPDSSIIDPSGSVLPKPKTIKTESLTLGIEPRLFNVSVFKSNQNGFEAVQIDIIEKAISRLFDNTFTDKSIVAPEDIPRLSELIIRIENIKIDLPIDEDESYKISLTDNKMYLNTVNVWGVIRGLATFSQLIYQRSQDFKYVINSTNINDNPSLKYRAVMVNIGTSYIKIRKLEKLIDGLESIKMNKLILQLSSNYNFAFPMPEIPELSRYNRPYGHSYSIIELKHLLIYGFERGIDVTVKINLPDETASWAGVPNLVQLCDDKLWKRMNAIVNPAEPITYETIKSIIQNLSQVFSNSDIFFGSRPKSYDCWKKNTKISQFMKELNIVNDYDALTSIFVSRVSDLAKPFFKNIIVSSNTVTQEYSNPEKYIINVEDKVDLSTLKNWIKQGYKLLLSSCSNLNYYQAFVGYQQFFKCQYSNREFNKEELDNIIGGVAELSDVTDTDVLLKSFTPGFAVSEALWNFGSYIDYDDVYYRMHEQMCRFTNRNIPTRDWGRARNCLKEFDHKGYAN